MSNLDYLAGVANLTGKTPDQLLNWGHPLFRIVDTGDGSPVLGHWDESLGPAPTIMQIVAAANTPGESALFAHADARLATYWAGHITVNVDVEGAPAPLPLLVDVTMKGQTFVSGLLADVLLGSTSETWFQAGGSVALSADQVRAVGVALKGYVQSAMAVWQAAERGIAEKTITTFAQIDALDWPPLAQS